MKRKTNGNGQTSSRINKSMCSKCGREFWRWESNRTECLLCKPLSPRETQRILKASGCDQPAVRVVAQEIRWSNPASEKSSEIHPVKYYPSKILQFLLPTRPS